MPVLPPSPSLGQEFILFNGPLFIGSILNWALLGTVTLQVYAYFRANFRDEYCIRGLVVVVYVIDLIQTAFATQCVWYLSILHWGDATMFEKAPWTSATFPITAGISAVLVQIFFAWRIWNFGRHWIVRGVAVLIVLIGLMQCLSGIIFGVQSLSSSTLNVAGLKAGSTVWLGGAAACDIIIVVAMLFILHSIKTPAGSLETKGLVDRLMIQTVESGAVTAAAASAELILNIVSPHTFLYSAIVLFLGKLYSNVLLANLNRREAGMASINNILARIDLPDNISSSNALNRQHNSYGVDDAIVINVFKRGHSDSQEP